jgi:hypothetical protein
MAPYIALLVWVLTLNVTACVNHPTPFKEATTDVYIDTAPVGDGDTDTDTVDHGNVDTDTDSDSDTDSDAFSGPSGNLNLWSFETCQ